MSLEQFKAVSMIVVSCLLLLLEEQDDDDEADEAAELPEDRVREDELDVECLPRPHVDVEVLFESSL